MKRVFSIMIALILITTSLTVSATEGNIIDIAGNNGSFTILMAALQETGLDSALEADGPFTVFAPTDDAFEELLEALNITPQQLLNQPDLSKVLLYHVISGNIMSNQLTDSAVAQTLNGESVTIDLTDGVKINDSSVILADIPASNGVIHVIDNVLIPSNFSLEIEEEQPTIFEIAEDNESFSILAAAIGQAELEDALNSEGPYTVFAPTNDAFVELLAALDITPEQLLNQPDLAKVLLYHVISGNIMSNQLTDGAMPETLNGETVTIDLTEGVMINSANVITADIEASNGVIHVIDKVLVPSNFNLIIEEELPSILEIASDNEAFSILVSAIGQAGLEEALAGDGPFTVLAPTNDAFTNLLSTLDITAEQLLEQPDLAKVLLYHVINGQIMSTDLVNGSMPATLNGESVVIDLTNGVKINNANVVTADIEASNGVIHVIDMVLVPNNFSLEDEDEQEYVEQFRERISSFIDRIKDRISRFEDDEPDESQDVNDEPQDNEDEQEEPQDNDDEQEESQDNNDEQEEPQDNNDEQEEPQDNNDEQEEPQDNDDEQEEPQDNDDEQEDSEENVEDDNRQDRRNRFRNFFRRIFRRWN